MKLTITLILFIVGFNGMIFAQNLDSIPPQLRDSMLIEIAKITVLRYGPGYYRDYKKPEITRNLYPSKNMNDPENANRPYYKIQFIYDSNFEKDKFSWSHIYEVYVWADNTQPFSAMFGNGLGRIVSPSDGERIANLVRKKMKLPTTKPDNYDYKLKPVDPNPYQPIPKEFFEQLERDRKLLDEINSGHRNKN